MRQNHSENCACSALYDPSIGSSSPRTSEKSPFKTHFQQPASEYARWEACAVAGALLLVRPKISAPYSTG
jgi:hypothetical protein